jgi:hypothetical protein
MEHRLIPVGLLDSPLCEPVALFANRTPGSQPLKQERVRQAPSYILFARNMPSVLPGTKQ